METFKTEYKHSIVLRGKGKDRTITTYLNWEEARGAVLIHAGNESTMTEVSKFIQNSKATTLKLIGGLSLCIVPNKTL